MSLISAIGWVVRTECARGERRDGGGDWENLADEQTPKSYLARRFARPETRLVRDEIAREIGL